MIITYLGEINNNLIDKLSIIAPEITSFIDNVDDYTKVTVTGTKTCQSIPIVETLLSDADLEVDTGKFYFDLTNHILYINPSFFSLSTFTDGVYKIDTKFVTSTGYVLISNCIFVDITYKCKVAALLQNIIEENRNIDNEKESTIIHLLHYSLINGSNCGCNCSEMCIVFNEITSLLTNIDPLIVNDCGHC